MSQVSHQGSGMSHQGSGTSATSDWRMRSGEHMVNMCRKTDSAGSSAEKTDSAGSCA